MGSIQSLVGRTSALAPQNQPLWSPLRSSESGGVYIPSHLCTEGLQHFLHFSIQYSPAKEPSRYPAEMTTTTTFQGMDPGAKSSSRVLRPPGGETSLSFGSEENTTPRKNKMVSNIFAEPDDPHANRRTEPPTGPATGTLCGEPSAPLRRCQQPILFPKNPQPELTTIHNSGAAMVWRQRQQENGQVNDNPDEVEGEQDEQEQPNQQETPQPSAPSGGANAGGRRNPPGGKSSLILG